MILSFFLPATLLASAMAAPYDSIPIQYRRGANNPDPTVGVSADGGWESMPDIPDAATYPEWVVDASLGAKLVRRRPRSSYRAPLTSSPSHYIRLAA